MSISFAIGFPFLAFILSTWEETISYNGTKADFPLLGDVLTIAHSFSNHCEWQGKDAFQADAIWKMFSRILPAPG